MFPSACVRMCVCLCVGVLVQEHSCFSNQTLNGFPEFVRERQKCCSISRESPADYMSFGINKIGRFVQSEQTSGSFHQCRMTNRQTNRQEEPKHCFRAVCHLITPSGNHMKGIQSSVWLHGLCCWMWKGRYGKYSWDVMGVLGILQYLLYFISHLSGNYINTIQCFQKNESNAVWVC